MKTNRVIIAGSRTVDELTINMSNLINRILSNLPYNDLEIISGTCRGADRLGEYFAKQNGMPIKQFPADWNTYGKGAGYIRNKQMAEYATHLIAIWDGKSKGTKLMIDLAKEYGLKVRIVHI